MQLSPEEDQKLAERPFDNVEAFECYHRARQQIYTFSEQGLDRAIELIDEAAAIVGDHELLHATKGTVYFQYVNAALKDDLDYIERADECARQVFAVKPDSPHGLALLGLVRLLQSRQPESVRLFKRALALDPHSWYAIVELGRIYHCAGRFSQARTQYSAGLAVDPMSPILRGALLSNIMMAGYLDIALRELPALVQAVPPFGYLRWTYAVSLIAAGRAAEALVVLEACPRNPRRPSPDAVACS
jgi:tetratricopeptide (TPR) repeat protein